LFRENTGATARTMAGLQQLMNENAADREPSNGASKG